MTIKRRLIVSPSEIKAVTLQCSRCSYSMSVGPQDALIIPEECPQGHRWTAYMGGGSGPEKRLAEALSHAIKVEAQATDRGFSLLLEFDAPNP